MRTALLLFLLWFCNLVSAQAPDASILKVKAPSSFRAVFKTTKGDLVIEAVRSWSPLGVDRLYQLILSRFYDRAILFRVEPAFVTQFGISADKKQNRFWDPKKLRDEPRRQKNTRGTIAFARDGKDDRCTQLFINHNDNPKLDTTVRNGLKGYVPIARVVKGMDVLSKLYAKYGKRPAAVQDSLYKYGNDYFENHFPGLDQVISARILK